MGVKASLLMSKVELLPFMNKPRYRTPAGEHALAAGKMAFIGGPRQVGKTTLALALLGPKAAERHPAYFNWDDPRAAARLRRAELPAHEPLLVCDEVRTYARWRNLLKGIYDTERSSRRIVVTGSARLDYYRKGGDSLADRYRYFRLHPFTLREPDPNPGASHLALLFRFGGFPEPLFRQHETEHRIWRRDRLARVVREDLRDLERVREVSLVEQLVGLLPERVGSPLSVANLSRDVEVDHKTVDRWLTILEHVYICFRLPPFGSPESGRSRRSRSSTCGTGPTSPIPARASRIWWRANC